jgi:hypothetical protein
MGGILVENRPRMNGNVTVPRAEAFGGVPDYPAIRQTGDFISHL